MWKNYFVLSTLVYLCCYDEVPLWMYGLMLVSLVVGSLLRADRLYSSLVLVMIVIMGKSLKSKDIRKQLLIKGLIICLLTIGIIKGVGAVIQVSGINGRIQTNLEFVLLDRIVWPNMTANYEYFSDEIKGIITLEEAQKFDSHNNNVMYQMAPLVESQVGVEKAKSIYKEMALVVLSRQPGKVFGDIVEDILAMLGTPISSYLYIQGKCEKNDSWNIHCMSSVDGDFTRLYLSYYHYSFLFLLAFGILGFLITKEKKKSVIEFKKFLKVVSPFFLMGIILTLWFSIGDGVPPNDRYALLIYYNWSLLSMGLLKYNYNTGEKYD